MAHQGDLSIGRHYNALFTLKPNKQSTYPNQLWYLFNIHHRRRQSRATALSPQIIREEIAPNAEFESGGTLFRLFDMYETCNASGETIIACAYYDVHVAESLGHDLQVHLFCNLCELFVRFIPSNLWTFYSHFL